MTINNRSNHMKRYSLHSFMSVLIGCAFAIAGAMLPAAASGFAGGPTGAPILSISGNIGATTTKELQIDIAMLESLPKTTIKTSTPWTEGVASFEGVKLRDLLDAAQAKGANLKAVALNDYAVELPVSDAELGAIVAFRLNGAEMSIRDKGPLWIVYPFDDRPELKSETIYSRCIWQLKSLIVSD